MSPLYGRLFIAWFACRLIWGLVIYIRGMAYDVADIRAKKARLAHPYARKYRAKPLVSIIIAATNAESTLEQCLQSIVKGSYKKYEIIVVDNASADATKQIATQFIDSHPKQKIRLVKKRKPTSFPSVVKSLNKKWYTGELVLIIDAGGILQEQAVTNAVRHFVSVDTDALRLNTRLQLGSLTSARLAQVFDALLASKKRKMLGAWSDELVSPALLLRRTVLTAKSSSGRLPTGISYAHDAVITQRASETYLGAFTSLYKLTAADSNSIVAMKPAGKKAAAAKYVVPLLDILAFSYLSYLVIFLQSTLLFAASWFVLLVVLGIAVWSESSLTISEKRLLTALLPVAYLFLVAASVIKLASRLAAAAVPLVNRVYGEIVRVPFLNAGR